MLYVTIMKRVQHLKGEVSEWHMEYIKARKQTKKARVKQSKRTK